MSGQKVIKVSEVLNDLQNGLTREEIGEKLGLNGAQVKRLFQHEKLKFKKTIKPDNFVVEDDTEAEAVVDSPVANQPELPLETTTEEVAPVVETVATAVTEETVSAVSEDSAPISTWETTATEEVEAAEAEADAHSQLGMQVEDDTAVSA